MNGTRTHNHLVRKRTPNHLAKLASLVKWLSFRLRTKRLWVRIQLQSFNIIFEHIHHINAGILLSTFPINFAYKSEIFLNVTKVFNSENRKTQEGNSCDGDRLSVKLQFPKRLHRRHAGES